MNKSFVLGALIFAFGVSVGVAISNNEKKNNTTDKDTIHGVR